eukprot:1194202-Prorocentrum_minimum.AAC.1
MRCNGGAEKRNHAGVNQWTADGEQKRKPEQFVEHLRRIKEHIRGRLLGHQRCTKPKLPPDYAFGTGTQAHEAQVGALVRARSNAERFPPPLHEMQQQASRSREVLCASHQGARGGELGGKPVACGFACGPEVRVACIIDGLGKAQVDQSETRFGHEHVVALQVQVQHVRLCVKRVHAIAQQRTHL